MSLENLENTANFNLKTEIFNFEDQNFIKKSTANGNTRKTFQQTHRIRNKKICRATVSKTTEVLAKSIRKLSNSVILTQIDKGKALGANSQAFQEAQKFCYQAWQQVTLLPRRFFAFTQYKLKLYQSLSFLTHRPEQRNPLDLSVIETKLIIETAQNP